MTRPKFRQQFDANSATMTLKDGRQVYFPEGLKVGGPASLMGDKTDTPLPVGSYELQYGKKFTVTVPGIVATVIDDVKAGAMSYQTEKILKRTQARIALSLQLKKLNGK